jgi:hypothetical protein
MTKTKLVGPIEAALSICGLCNGPVGELDEHFLIVFGDGSVCAVHVRCDNACAGMRPGEVSHD